MYMALSPYCGDEFSYEEKRQRSRRLKASALSVPNVKKISLIGGLTTNPYKPKQAINLHPIKSDTTAA